MSELNSVASTLLDKLKMRFGDVATSDQGAKPTAQPEEARFFNFDYVIGGQSYGNVTISINDGKSLKVFFGRNITKKLDDADRQEWYAFLKSLRSFARRNMLTFDTRDISRRSLTQKDIQEMADQDMAQTKTVAESIKFGPLAGYKRSSHQKLGPARIIIRHARPVDETVRGSRTRYIESLFIENADGERFKLPFTKLSGARAMARHVSEGGSLSDDIGCSIKEMVVEMSDLQNFVRSMGHREFEDQETAQMMEAARERFHELKDTLSHMQSTRGYRKFKERFSPSNVLMDEVDIEELKDRFTQKSFPERLEAALPRVYNAYARKMDQKERQLESVRGLIESGAISGLARSSGNRLFLETFEFSDTRSLVTKVLEEIIEAAGPQSGPLAEFAKKWSDKLRVLDEQVDETLKEEYGLAVQLASQYIKGLNEARSNESQDRNNSEDEIQIARESDEFAEWAESITEDEIDPVDPDTRRLQELVVKHFPVGQDANNAINVLGDLINDEDLNDQLYELADSQGPDADARPLILGWLKENDPARLQDLDFGDTKMEETVGGDPVDDFLDSIEDPDILKYGADTMGEPVELYRRMGGLI